MKLWKQAYKTKREIHGRALGTGKNNLMQCQQACMEKEGVPWLIFRTRYHLFDTMGACFNGKQIRYG